MPIDPEPELERLAGAVADATPIDWEAELARTPESAPVLGHLRRLEALARVSLADDAEPPAAPAAFHWGPLAALEKLGEGSFGEVWKAWDPALQRAVALKLRRASPSAGSDRRWLEEARRLARVRHPNVLAVHGADVHDGRAGLWTDLLQGATLEALLKERGTFGAREAALVGIELCGALAAVHAAGLVHGDVKTGNVMREGEAGSPAGSGRIVLMDFGSAHDTARPGAAAFGTPLAVAPEVLAGATPTARSDVYALGVLLYRLVTGRYPVEAETVSELAERAARGERLPLRTARPDLPSPFVQAIERALEPDPVRRFAHPAAMESALAGALASAREGAGAGDVPVPGLGLRPPWKGRVVPLAVVAAIGFALAIGSADWFERQRRDASPVTRGRGGPVAGTATPSTATSPSSSPTPAPAAVALPPPRVDMTLVRGEEDGREKLADGDVVGPGDRIALELEADEKVHAYVVSEDAGGETFVLFPLGARGAANPLAAGVRHRLPGRADGQDLDWVVTSAGGRESFLVLAAREPIRLVERTIAALPVAADGRAVRLPVRPGGVDPGTRGIGGVAARPSPPDAAPPRGLLRLMEALRREPGAAVWMELVVLENPAP